jgi:hypothetical protein
LKVLLPKKGIRGANMRNASSRILESLWFAACTNSACRIVYYARKYGVSGHVSASKACHENTNVHREQFMSRCFLELAEQRCGYWKRARHYYGHGRLAEMGANKNSDQETWCGLTFPDFCLACFCLSTRPNAVRPSFTLGTSTADILGTQHLLIREHPARWRDKLLHRPSFPSETLLGFVLALLTMVRGCRSGPVSIA